MFVFRHPQGSIRFEDYFFASECATVGGGESAPGNGGGIFNGATGDIVFKGKMKMTDCGTFVSPASAPPYFLPLTLPQHAPSPPHPVNVSSKQLSHPGICQNLINSSAVSNSNTLWAASSVSLCCGNSTHRPVLQTGRKINNPDIRTKID